MDSPDLRHAIRRLRNSPGFSAVALVTIALAIGANTAVFSLVNGMLLRPLPYPESDRIVQVLERLPDGGRNAISTLNYLDFANLNSVFDNLAAEAEWHATLGGGDEPVFIRGARVSAHYFDIFGVTAAMGRTFRSDDDRPGNDRVVLLSHALWASRFGSDPAILDRSIRLNDETYVVIGVLPPDGPFDRAATQIWKPLAFRPEHMTRDFRWLAASGKLRSDETLRRAQSQMDVIAERLASEYPDSNKGWGVAVDRLSDVVISPDARTAVTILFTATLFVWLIACANLVNLALARGLSREREMAVRAALGGSRARLVRQFLTEHVLLAVGGGTAGLLVGYVTLKWIHTLIPPEALPPAVDIRMGASAVFFALAIAVVTGVLVGLVAALRATSPDPVAALKEAGRGAAPDRRARQIRGALVIAEVALAFVLLSASGALTRSLIQLLDVDPGFESANVLTAGLPINQAQHPDPIELNTYLASIRSAVGAVPGVQQTAITSVLPLRGWGYGARYAIADRTFTPRINRRLAFFKVVSPTYFDVLRMTLRQGRALRDTDVTGSPRVALINETMARREFPDQNPIGHRILVPAIAPGTARLGDDVAWEIVGVVANEDINGLGDDVSAGMYVSNAQSPTYDLSLIARTTVPPDSLQKVVRATVAGVNRGQALSDVRTLEDVVRQSTMGNRVLGTLIATFAALALVLSAVGTYGVISYTTAERRHELGIRAALGASPGSLRRLVFRGGMRLTLAGFAMGLVGTFATTRTMSSLLYGVGAQDPGIIVIAAIVLLPVAGLACYLPARRITRVDPMDVLRP